MAKLSGLKVLIVDDNDDAAEALAALLMFDGADTRVEHDATHIVAVVREFNPTLVLLDLELTGVDGCDACQQIRELRGEGIYIAALTGWSREQDKARSQAAGFDIHLLKPIEPAWLLKLGQFAFERRGNTT